MPRINTRSVELLHACLAETGMHACRFAAGDLLAGQGVTMWWTNARIQHVGMRCWAL
jgi:hypothetical protein